jgi:small subunit ribosomal protein S17
MPKTIIGIVSSNKADKTITITTTVRKTHPLYRKQYTVTRKYMAHDEKNEAQPGDKVSITETRPISARKHFKLSEIIEKPKLREDNLAPAKSEDTGKKPVKPKAEEDEQTEKEEIKPAKKVEEKAK